MAIYADYQNTDSLETTSFIAGTKFTFVFPVVNSSGQQMNAGAYSLTWVLSPYGQPEYRLLQKQGTLSGSTAFIVTLDEKDTISLGGQYLQQPILRDISGDKIRPAQGIVNIRKAIPTL